MGKRKAKPNPDQLGFVFDPPAAASMPGELAGLERQVSMGVSDILHEDPRSREEIAAKMSELLGEDVSRSMLDAYSSPAREDHKVPFSRFVALVSVCNRHDVLDRLVRKIGAGVLVGAELHTARIGDIDRRIEQLRAEKREVSKLAPVIKRRRT